MYQNPRLTQQLNDIKQADMRRVAARAHAHSHPDALITASLRLARPLTRRLAH